MTENVLNEANSIHIIDQDEAVRNSLIRLLQPLGVQVIQCSTAEIFLNQLNTRLPACLLIEVHLPGISGLELLKRLNAMNIKIPSILFATHSDVPTAVHAMRAGAFDFIEKPFVERQLISRIQEILNITPCD